jgi:hypothetical protein
MKNVKALAVVVLVLATCTSDALAMRGGGMPGQRVMLSGHGISFVLPATWHVTFQRVNAVTDPVTLFTATTYPFRPRATSTGVCSKSLQAAWRADGAYIHLVEELDGASRKRMLRRVPQRPRHFELNARGAGGLCTPADSGELVFKQGGRAFYVFYGFGKKASGATRVAAATLLDSLRIAPRVRGR